MAFFCETNSLFYLIKNDEEQCRTQSKEKEELYASNEQAFQLDYLSIQGEVIAITANWLKQLGKIEDIKVLAIKNLLM